MKEGSGFGVWGLGFGVCFFGGEALDAQGLCEPVVFTSIIGTPAADQSHASESLD